MIPSQRALTILGLLATALLAACAPADGPSRVRVASTTSLYDTGLLDELVPAFERAHPEYDLQVVAVGTGEALALGERGDADVLIVHAPEREIRFVQDGHGVRRSTFMRNDFVLAGPGGSPAGDQTGDPGGIADAGTVSEAMRRIADAGERGEAEFVSRGDDSGTHIRERMLWSAAGIEPAGDWYLEVGQGMGATVQFAGERGAYLLTDRATLTVLGANGAALSELYAGDPELENLYTVIPVSLRPDERASAGALAFERWILGDEAAAIIREFGVVDYRRALFTLTPR